MRGINLNCPLVYKHSSLRFFAENECHIDRLCRDDVLLLVYEGTLRFTENGKEYAITPGQYHIQQQGSTQRGHCPSDSPKYLYVHFLGTWADHGETLPYTGEFDYPEMKELLEQLDRMAHEKYTLAEQSALFLQILSILYRKGQNPAKGNEMAAYLRQNYRQNITLTQLAQEFHYSKNQIIHIFKENFDQTPVTYLNHVRLQRALHLLEATSRTTVEIAQACGFQNYSHFHRLFLRKTGVSPAIWRKNRRLMLL
jgi:AraC-like DNA-binding protein